MLDDWSVRISEGGVWVIEKSTNIVGILVLLPKPDHLLLGNIAVAPMRQSLGLDRRLLAFAEAEATRQGYREIRLYTQESMIENHASMPQSATRKPGAALGPDTSAFLCGNNLALELGSQAISFGHDAVG